jgi:hypothetical protein
MPSKSRNGWNAAQASPWSRKHRADYCNRLGTGQQIALEDLDVLEAGVGDRAELGPQRAVDADRGDGSQHDLCETRARRWSRG